MIRLLTQVSLMVVAMLTIAVVLAAIVIRIV